MEDFSAVANALKQPRAAAIDITAADSAPPVTTRTSVRTASDDDEANAIKNTEGRFVGQGSRRW